jgi:NitT/TauT family transport system ATP-binding protein
VASIRLNSVTKQFASRGGAVTALQNVDLAVEKNQFVALVGASGCGKSTLLNLVAGFETPTRGEVRVNDQAAGRPGPDRGFVFQRDALFPWLSVRENIKFGLTLKAGKGRFDPDERTELMLQRVGLKAFADHFPAQLSGGMRQRAAIASVLAIDPPVLLMDEPFGALDSLTRSVMHDFLLEIWDENPRTVLLVTHDITEAIYLADKVVVMTSHPGRIKEEILIDLPRPRDFHIQSSQRFVALREHITTIVRAEAAKVGEMEHAAA